MTHEIDHAKTIFLRAIESQSPDQWEAYLDDACGDDAPLRLRVAALLNAHQELGSFRDENPDVAKTIDCPPEAAGAQIGPYKLLQQIGEGGMGTVYMAEQTHPVQRKVALKVIKAGMDSRQVIARFEAERQALAMMDHVNIARVLDAGATPPSPPSQGGAWGGGRPYFVMELVHGVPITKYCDDNHLTPRERLELFVPVCQAIQHAHQKGIIHRDIKPSNVMVTLYDGKPVPKVIDFGVAKAIEQTLTERTLFTQYGTMVGTLEYMSPEQAEMSALGVDTRSDIFSLGVLLYELLTGTTPLTHKRMKEAAYGEILQMIKEEEAPKPSTRLSDSGEALASISAQRHMEPAKLAKLVRGELDWIVMKTLEKDRNRRYETAKDFAADVQRYLTDEPVQACPPSAMYRFRKFARRNKAMLTTASALAAAILVAVVSLIGAVTVLAESNAQSKKEQQETENALGREKQVNDDLHKSLEREARIKYCQNIQLADRELAADNLGRAEELLDECPAHFRGWEWQYLKRRRHQEPVTFRGHGDWISGVALSPDGTRAVSGSVIALFIGDLKVWDAVSGKTIRTLLGHLGPIAGVAYSVDGKTLASGSWDRTVRLWDTTTWRSRHTLEGHTDYVSCVALSPDNRLVASGSGDKTVKLWDAQTGQELRTLRGHSRGITSVAFSPDGRSLATGSHHEVVRIFDVATGKEVHALHGHAGTILGLAYSRDGRRLASASFDGSVRIWEATTGRHVRTLRADIMFAMSVAFNRDGTRLAVGSWDKTVKLWDPETGQEVLTLRGHDDMVSGVAFSEDGRLLASSSFDGSVKVWDATLSGGGESGETLLLRGQGDALLSLLYSPDGRHLASAGFDGTVKLSDPLTGKEVRSLGGDDGPVISLSFSRDGQRLASATMRGVVKLWNVPAGKEIAAFGGNLGAAVISPDGQRVAWTRDGGFVEIHDIESGRQLLEFHTHPAPVIWVGYSPDGKRLATTSWDKTAKVWDATSQAELFTLRGHTHVIQFVVYSPDGQRLATASWDKTAKVWDAATGKEIFTLRGHKDRVGSATFSPDGKYLATASADNTVKVWDGKTGVELHTLRGHAGYVGNVAFSPDSKRVATASGYRGRWEIKIWDATQWDGKRK